MPEHLFRSDHTNIGHIAIESPKAERGLAFDLRNELAPDALDWLRQQVENKNSATPVGYLGRLEQAKILLPNEDLLTNGMPDGFWEQLQDAIDPEAGDHLRNLTRVWAGVSMKTVNPEWLKQPLFHGSNFAERYEQLTAHYIGSVDVRMLEVTTLLGSIILFPDNPTVTRLADLSELSAHAAIERLVSFDSGLSLQHLRATALFRLACPEKWQSSFLPPEFWVRAIETFGRMHDYVDTVGGYHDVTNAAASLTILAARQARFTANGLELVGDDAENELVSSALPDERKY